MSRSLLTRILHAAIAAAILIQLLLSLMAERPRPSGRAGNFAYSLHEIIGLVSLAVLFLYWLWALVRRNEHSPAALLPWFSPARRRALLQDIRDHIGSIAKFRLPDPAEETPLASAIHGLGLCAATVMAITGAVVFLSMAADGSMTAAGRSALSLHRLFANLMWAYLIGHAGIAVLHDVQGHRVTRRILLGD